MITDIIVVHWGRQAKLKSPTPGIWILSYSDFSGLVALKCRLPAMSKNKLIILFRCCKPEVCFGLILYSIPQKRNIVDKKQNIRVDFTSG